MRGFDHLGPMGALLSIGATTRARGLQELTCDDHEESSTLKLNMGDEVSPGAFEVLFELVIYLFRRSHFGRTRLIVSRAGFGADRRKGEKRRHFQVGLGYRR